MKVLYVLDVQQLHTFDELSISFVVSRAIIQVHMFLAEGLIIQDVKPINSVCLGNPWNHSAIWPVVLLWPFGLVGSFALSAVKDATFGGWEAWSVESRWDQGWCRVELYDLYTFSEQDRSDFDGFCIMYLWKCLKHFKIIGCVQFQLYVLICAWYVLQFWWSLARVDWVACILITWSSRWAWAFPHAFNLPRAVDIAGTAGSGSRYYQGCLCGAAGEA